MDEGTAELYEKLGRIVRKEGWLWQRGGGLTDWVRRYVKLSGCCILFYERADDVSSEGVLPLHKCSVVIIGETDDGRESVFKLDSELWSTDARMKEWTCAISNAIEWPSLVASVGSRVIDVTLELATTKTTIASSQKQCDDLDTELDQLRTQLSEHTATLKALEGAKLEKSLTIASQTKELTQLRSDSQWFKNRLDGTTNGVGELETLQSQKQTLLNTMANLKTRYDQTQEDKRVLKAAYSKLTG